MGPSLGWRHAADRAGARPDLRQYSTVLPAGAMDAGGAAGMRAQASARAVIGPPRSRRTARPMHRRPPALAVRSPALSCFGRPPAAAVFHLGRTGRPRESPP